MSMKGTGGGVGVLRIFSRVGVRTPVSTTRMRAYIVRVLGPSLSESQG